jgi:hypothetical protein
MARGVQHEDPDRRGEIGGAAAGVDRHDEVRQRLPARGRDLPQRLKIFRFTAGFGRVWPVFIA